MNLHLPGIISITPGFSQVTERIRIDETVSTVFQYEVQTVETVFAVLPRETTRLKPGVNERGQR